MAKPCHFELKETIKYLEENWSEKELRDFSSKLDHVLELISKNPKLFPESIEIAGTRKAVIEKHTLLQDKKQLNRTAFSFLESEKP